MTTLRIGVVTQLRNEADVLPAFLAHVAAFADMAVLMDHGSVDGSHALAAAACRGRQGWEAWRIAVPGYHQAAFAGFAARHLLRAGADRVLFLDADEFVDLPDRAAVQAALARMDGPGDVGTWSWRDCIPDRLDQPLALGSALWQAPSPSRYPKVVLSQAVFRASGGQAGPQAGAHFLQGVAGPIRNVPLGDLLHVPLRSVEQMRRKVVLGSLAELARSDRGATDNSHWAEALARLAAGALDDDDVRGFAARYGEPGAPGERLPAAGLPARGFTRRSLDMAHADLAHADLAHANLAHADAPAVLRGPVAAPNAWQAVADALRTWAPAPSAGLVLELAGDVLRAAAAPPVWPDPVLVGTPLLDLARKALPAGSRVLAIGNEAAALAAAGVQVVHDPAAGPFDAVLVDGLTAVRVAAAHAALPPGGLLIGEGDAAAADPAVVAVVADALRPGYGDAAPGAADTSWDAALDRMFQVEQRHGLGGALLRPALAGMAGRFRWDDKQDATVGRLVAALDRLLTRHGTVPPGRSLVVARRLP